MIAEKDRYIFGVCKVNDKGQIVIPKEAREIFKVKSGDSLLLVGDKNKGLALIKTEVIESVAEGVFDNGK